MNNRLGLVTGGSFNANLMAKLDPGVSTENLRIGDFVVVEGEKHVFFCSVADIQLNVTDAGIQSDPPNAGSRFIREALEGTATYAMVQVKPSLAVEKPEEGGFVDVTASPQPARTIPMHFAVLRSATQPDFDMVFGEDDGKGSRFFIGTPLTMPDQRVPIDLSKLMERSNGIFGQSGTGKSFTTLLILSGIIRRKVGVALIFDMHDEYAFGKESEEKQWVKGLKNLFPTRVQVWSIEQDAARRSGRAVDQVIQIGLNQIEPEDVLLLAEELDLRGTTEANIGLLQDRYKSDWLKALLRMTPEELEEFAQESGAHSGSLAALQRKLKVISRRPYVREEAGFDKIDEMVALLDKGTHVIMHFGPKSSTLDHMLVANVVTRRVRKLYQDKTAKYEETRSKKDEPKPLMIVVEEAHKFLAPSIARQTIFGELAREMRKYHVVLTVIDQRPGAIDREVLSQLGTRITGKLTDENDIEAVLTGVASRQAVRGMIESLDTRGQVVIVGHAIPMPLALNTRHYDEAFWQEMLEPDEGAPPVPKGEDAFNELF